MRIGQLAGATGVSAKALRFYEDQGLIPPPDRTASGYRSYSEGTVDRVLFIRRAQAAGLKLDQIKQVLDVRDSGRAPCAHVNRLVEARLAEIDHRLRELRAARAELRELRHRLSRLDPANCEASDVCTAIADRGHHRPGRAAGR